MRKYLALILLLPALLTACGAPAPSPTPLPTATAIPPTETPTIAPTATPEPTFTPTPLPTSTPTATATPVWVYQKGTVTCPILLYHRIATAPAGQFPRYYVSPEAFAAQMTMLHDLGYTTIPISLLVDAIVKGANLPPRPIVITFDDGDISVYAAAFPVMKRLGFTGTFFLVGDYLNADGYVGDAQVTEMIAAGWEIGSHSMTHVDLRQRFDLMQQEGRQSKLFLEKRFGVPVNVFAYPFGAFTAEVGAKIRSYGYNAAVGLDVSYLHDWSTLYLLSRIEVMNEYSLDDLKARLPWSAP